jgi:alpha-tubulin suppressor-like RCC1 family protein
VATNDKSRFIAALHRLPKTFTIRKVRFHQKMSTMNHKSVRLAQMLLPAAFVLWLMVAMPVTTQATTAIRHVALTDTSTGLIDYRERSFGDGKTNTFTLASKVFLPLTFQAHPQGKTTLAAGGEHTCSLTSGGGVKCWGKNYENELGDGTWIDRNKPVDVIGLHNGVLSIAAGRNINYVLTADGGTKTWGDGAESVVTDVFGLPREIIKVDGRFFYACAITQTGGVKCWGNNLTGPVDIVGLNNGVIDIATEGYMEGCGLTCWYVVNHSCAALGSGGVKCWGEDNVVPGTSGDRHTPMEVTGLQGSASALATGWNDVCALLTSGAVTCWDAITPPGIVPGLDPGITAITSGGSHYCVLTTNGGVKCWGSNYGGQLGDGSYTYSEVPVNVVGLSSGVTEIAAGDFHTCARLGTFGSIKCWGYNSSGQLGNGTFVSSTIPVDVIGLITP